MTLESVRRLGPMPLIPALRSYDWGSRHAIADLFGWVATDEPMAELWFGAHPEGSARLTGDRRPSTLAELIEADPHEMLGPAVAEDFGPRLPFLLKILAADTPLSLQVHPSAAQARAGFADETARGVPRSAPERNYRDDNHKPELLCAITEFWALSGFRRVVDTVRFLRELGIAEMAPLRMLLAPIADVQSTVEAMLTASTAQNQALVDGVVCGAHALITRDSEWVDEATWVLSIAAAFPGDVGIVLACLLNLVHLRPGEFIFVPAGQVHGYLSGTGVEIMASSDNVLRCGLTGKHVDRAEVIRIADFSDGPSVAQQPVRRPTGELVFDAAVRDFALSRLTMSGGPDFNLICPGAQIVLGVAGQLTLHAVQHETPLYPGTAVFVPAGVDVWLRGTGDAFRAMTNPMR
jgi:mannose-6-phosphate isomerase